MCSGGVEITTSHDDFRTTQFQFNSDRQTDDTATDNQNIVSH
jgi:hypothetical protein